MGYFNINSILYNFRKIFKYLSISLFFITFLLLILFLMSKNVNATMLPDYPSFPSDADNYTYSVVVFRSDLNRYTLWLTNTRPYVDMNAYDSTYGYTGALIFSGTVKRYNFNSNTDSNWVDAGTTASMVFWGIENPNASIVPQFVFANFNILYANSDNVFFYETSTFVTPYIALPNNSTDTYINGEFSQFMIVTNNTIDSVAFFLECNPNILPVTNRVELILDENSPYYLNNYSPSDGGKVFLVPKFVLPQGYQNFASYNAWLSFDVGYHHYVTNTLEWTTNFSAKAIENDQIMQQSGMYDSLMNVNTFLTSDKVNESDIDLPSVQFDFNQDHFVSDLFTALRDAFTGTTYNDVVFTFPFSDYSITIPSNYIEVHCPTIILNLIRLFYWYIISRYMLKDVFRTVDKMRQGDWFIRSDSDIKTEVL